MATQNRCRCPSPPGGTVNCEPEHAAVCWVDEAGELHAACIAPSPKAMRQFLQRGGARQTAVLFGIASGLSEHLNVRAERIYEAITNDIRKASREERPIALELETPRGFIRLNIELPQMERFMPPTPGQMQM